MGDDEHKKDFVVTPRENKLFDEAHFADNDNRVKMITTLNGVVLVTLDADGKVVNVDPFDVDSGLKVSEKIFKTPQETAGAGTATITLTERLEIVGLHADATMSAVVANRNINVVVTIPVIVSGVVLALVNSSSILLTASQNGGFFFPSNHSHWTNDNTVVARVADENPFPMTFESGSAFQIVSDNDQVGDLMGIELWYKKVTP